MGLSDHGLLLGPASARARLLARRARDTGGPRDLSVRSIEAEAASILDVGVRARPRSQINRRNWGFMNLVTWDDPGNRLDAAGDPRSPFGLGNVERSRGGDGGLVHPRPVGDTPRCCNACGVILVQTDEVDMQLLLMIRNPPKLDRVDKSGRASRAPTIWAGQSRMAARHDGGVQPCAALPPTEARALD